MLYRGLIEYFPGRFLFLINKPRMISNNTDCIPRALQDEELRTREQQVVPSSNHMILVR